MGELVEAILEKYSDLIIHYHGHNTDGADIGRIVSAVRKGAKSSMPATMPLPVFMDRRRF